MKPYYIELDVARAVCAMGVLAVHLTALVLAGGDRVGPAYAAAVVVNQVSRFAVPVFILISGIGLTLNYDGYGGYGPFLKRRLSRVVPLYLIWSLVYLAYGAVSDPGAFSAWAAAKDLLLGGAHYHLYFIFTIIVFYLLFPLLRGPLARPGWVAACFLVSLAMLSAGYYVPIPPALEWFFGYRNILNWIFYFALGIWLAAYLPRLDKIRKDAWFGTVPFALLVLSGAGILADAFAKLAAGAPLSVPATTLKPLVTVYAAAFFFLILGFGRPGRRLAPVFKFVSKNSYGIYLAHPLGAVLLAAAFEALGLKRGMGFFAAGMLLIPPFSILVNRPVHRIIDVVSARSSTA